MTIYNLGSINIDYAYYVPHLPAGGETLAADSMRQGLGGKGLNQSIACARAGADVIHVGAIGAGDQWLLDALSEAGIETRHIRMLDDSPTGHAIINIDQQAENTIVLFPGANQKLNESQVDSALKNARTDDWLLLQNETNLGLYAAQLARSQGMKICYSAAPFDLEAIRQILPFADLLVVNEHEFSDIKQHLPDVNDRLQDIGVVVTRGAQGAEYLDNARRVAVDACKVEAVDTTGAGDTFLGFFLAGIDRGDAPDRAMQMAAAASALQVTREGAAEAIPALQDVLDFLQSK